MQQGMVRDPTGFSRCRGLRASVVAVLLVAAGGWHPAHGHPAHAEPVNYPFVVGFERFHSSLDDDDYLAEGGFILLNELNCVACHEPPARLADRLPGVTATDLSGVAARLNHLDLELMIRNPRFAKRDTVMPSLFAGPDRDLGEVKALKHYLATLTAEVPPYPEGDVEAGRRLYHRIGCVACHAPEVGYRPEGVPENARIELAGLPSVPLNLADLYDRDALVHFLLHPLEHRPSGRMPDFRLTEAQAADLATYLKAGPKRELPGNLTDALEGAISFQRDPALAERGRELFERRRCAVCHEIPGEGKTLAPAGPPPLARLDPASREACLSERPAGGDAPFYGLDEVQRRAIVAALERLDRWGRNEDEADALDRRLKRLNCYACHERDGVGGPEIAREVYFGFEQEAAVALGRRGNLPPALTGVGAKLTGDWLERILFGVRGGGRVRPYQSARMPLYRRSDVAPLAEAFPERDAGTESSESSEPPAGAVKDLDGGALLGPEGKNCVRCHGIGDRRWTEMPGIDLSTAPERLRPDYFRRLLRDPQSIQPGLPMPAAFAEGAEGDVAIEAIWRHLQSLSE